MNIMKPTENDVLSGRGAWFNQHPGNEHFRKMIDEQKAAYMAGTKKQKITMSNAIVEAIYSMDPPGRFLKKCADTGQWSELSMRDAADRAAQAMAYAVRGKDKSKRRREERRRSSLRSSRQESNDEDDDVGRKSPQSASRPSHLQQHATTDELRWNASSSVAHHGLDTRRGGAVGTSNDMPSASELLCVPGNYYLQQQLLLQRLQQPSTTTTTLPTSSVSSVDHNLDQHGLGQLLAQAMQQQQQQLQQQQLPLQYTMGQNPLGQLLHSQTPLQPALLEGLTHQLLNQAQQQQQQQQHQLLFQRLLNQQIVLPPASLSPTISLTAPFLTGHLSQPANNTLLQNMQRQSNTPSNALLLSSVLSSLQHQPNSSGGISNPPQGAQQADQLQHSLMLQQNQLLATSLGASSNNQLPFQQQQLQALDPLLQQTLQATLQLQQNLQGLPPPAPINNSTGIASANVAAQTSRREEIEDEVRSEPEDDDYCGD